MHAENVAKIKINDVLVNVNANENGHHRGLNIVVINPGNGEVVVARAFDTYKSSEKLDTFIRNGIPEGFIVVAACKDECKTQLSQQAKLWFENMGSE